MPLVTVLSVLRATRSTSWRGIRTGTECIIGSRKIVTNTGDSYASAANRPLSRSPTLRCTERKSVALKLGYAVEDQWKRSQRKRSTEGRSKSPDSILEAFSNSLGLSVREFSQISEFLKTPGQRKGAALVALLRQHLSCSSSSNRSNEESAMRSSFCFGHYFVRLHWLGAEIRLPSPRHPSSWWRKCDRG